MDIVLIVIGGVGGLVIGALAGFWLGGLIEGKQPWIYWTLNVVALLVGIAAATGALYIVAAQWLFVAAIGFEGGILTGLKYGYGRSVGVWAVHDRLTKNDQDMPH